MSLRNCYNHNFFSTKKIQYLQKCMLSNKRKSTYRFERTLLKVFVQPVLFAFFDKVRREFFLYIFGARWNVRIRYSLQRMHRYIWISPLASPLAQYHIAVAVVPIECACRCVLPFICSYQIIMKHTARKRHFFLSFQGSNEQVFAGRGNVPT